MIDEAYFEYLNDIYEKVTQWLNKKDHVADSTKREFFCDMIATPYYYWKKEEGPKDNQNFDKVGLLNALKKKYSLNTTKTGLKLPGYLGREEFKHLADNMRLCGYHYDSEEKEFRLEAPNHV